MTLAAPDGEPVYPVLMRRPGLRLRRWAQRALAREQGFTLIEVVLASVIFIGVATALLGTLTSSIVVHDLSRERTFAQQAATEQIECIRRLAYQDVGLYPSGNPTGRIGDTTVATQDYCKASPAALNKTGVAATMTTNVSYADDPGPSSYSTGANYKKVAVNVTRDSDGAALASQVTFVAPVQRAPFGGINNAILNVTVSDLALNTPLQGATVSLANGPSGPRSGTTDSAGLVSFAALLPGTPSDYYDISVAKTGYVTFVDDIPPLAPAHKNLAPASTVPATIRIYKPATINLGVTDGVGGPVHTGATTVKITSALTSTTQTYSVTGGSSAITTFGGQPLRPGVDYTVRGYTGAGLCSAAESKTVPDAYPTTLSTAYTVALEPCSVGTLVVDVTQLGGPAGGASVTVSAGPNDFAPIVQTTNASGQTTFTNLPSGTDPYSISVTSLGETATGSALVATGATTTASITVPDPPVGEIDADVHWLGLDVNGATVTVTGGPQSINQSLTTGPSGLVTFANLPAGSGYTVAATKNGQTVTQTGVTVTTGSTTALTFNMPTGTIAVTATWAAQAAGSAGVSITGGPDGGTYTGTTNASGTVSIAVPATTPAFPYTVTVTKNGGSGTSTVTSVTNGGTTATSVAMGGVGTIAVTATWAGQPAGDVGGTNTITITAGPNTGSSYTGTTSAAGTVSITVPATTAAFPYTVSASKNAGTGSSSVTSVANGGTTATGIIMIPTKTLTLLIRAGGVNIPNQPVTVSLTDGPNGSPSVTPAYQFVGNTNGSSQVILTVPSQATGSYRVKVYRTGCPGSTNRSRTQTVSALPGTTSATINMTTSTCPLTLP